MTSKTNDCKPVSVEMDPEVTAAAAVLMNDDTAYEDEPNAARRIATLMLEAAEAAAWRPIETAPKLDVITLTDGGYQVSGFWQNGRGWMSGWTEGDLIMQMVLRPTHWRPLPKPPSPA